MLTNNEQFVNPAGVPSRGRANGPHIVSEKPRISEIGCAGTEPCTFMTNGTPMVGEAGAVQAHGPDETRAEYGMLLELDLSDLSLPISEVRDYLAARYDSRFRVHPQRFEEFVASVFGDLGYDSRATSYSGDGGIDVVLNGSSGDTVGVQVKRYKGAICVEQIRAFTGALVLKGITKGIFVTTSRFQSGVAGTADVSAARGYPIELQDAERFYESLQLAQVESYRRSERPRPWRRKSRYWTDYWMGQ